MNFNVKSFDKITQKQVDWLWYPYIPFGKITLLQGDPGDGKSTLALLLTANLTSTKKTYGIKGLIDKTINVLYQSSEDSKEDTIKPKLEIFNANCSKAFYVDETFNLNSDLKNIILDNNIELFILDPIQYYVGNEVNLNNVAELRKTLSNIADVANDTKCAFLLIGHLNKSERSKDLYRGLGSIDIPAVARSILYLKKDEETDIRVIKQIKNSLCPNGKDVAFEFKDNNVVWLGEYIESGNVSKLDLAKELLIKLLQTNMMLAIDVYEQLENNGLSKRTIDRAKKDLNIESIKKENKWYWKLIHEVDDVS